VRPQKWKPVAPWNRNQHQIAADDRRQESQAVMQPCRQVLCQSGQVLAEDSRCPSSDLDRQLASHILGQSHPLQPTFGNDLPVGVWPSSRGGEKKSQCPGRPGLGCHIDVGRLPHGNLRAEPVKGAASTLTGTNQML
jgi:hypothetical protein